jgi:hypothetical protein
MAQPLGERADVVRQLNCVGLGLPCQFPLGRKGLACATLAGAVDPLMQLFALRGGALGQARQRVGQGFVLVLDVKHIAMAGRLAPGRLLPGTQALPCIGNRIVRLQPLLGGVEQMHTPGVSVAMLRRGEQIAVGRLGTDAGQHRHGALEQFIVQAHANGGQVLLAVDDSRFLRSRPQDVVDAAHTHRDAQQVTQEFHDAATRTAANQRQPDDHLAKPALGDH